MAQTREEAANATAQSLFTKNDPTNIKNEPELSAISQKLIYNDINKQIKLNTAKQELLTLVVLTANNTPVDIPAHVEGALRAGATPEQIHESIFQCTPYVGLPKVKAALERVDQVMEMLKIEPCAPAGTTTDETRHDAGLAVQRAIFGAENIDKMNAGAPADQKHINDYLSANCFGDYYTRKVLDVKERELITFTAIVTLGGCEPQAKAHAAANISVGNTRQDLLDALTIALPYIGYPRTLNGLSCVNAAAPRAQHPTH
ncbi:carboxymuconolactone decarboxylase family protein [Phascolarctobacterium succinatutens]|uniref:carboxymuconolactone decarboxylase family protein n=1 Tax=Phascolarctobacterium succinatutens TaxID=626940 RepID=UPI0026F035A0|nr:carboxymuconolactone decarboxylase family protein [Phascolarctobacterium succinatutens]